MTDRRSTARPSGELQDATGAEFVAELVDTFLQEAPAMLDDLRHALAARDADTFRRAAHSLKSNGNTFGALALGALARDLELPRGVQRRCRSARRAAAGSALRPRSERAMRTRGSPRRLTERRHG